jgi:outer membrane lipoprotein SlyB
MRRLKRALGGALVGGALVARLGGPAGFVIGAISGCVTAYSVDPKEDT